MVDVVTFCAYPSHSALILQPSFPDYPPQCLLPYLPTHPTPVPQLDPRPGSILSPIEDPRTYLVLLGQTEQTGWDMLPH